MTWIKRKLIIVVEVDCFLRLLCRFDITRELSSGDDGRLEGGVWVSPPLPPDQIARSEARTPYSSATLPQQSGPTDARNSVAARVRAMLSRVSGVMISRWGCALSPVASAMCVSVTVMVATLVLLEGVGGGSSQRTDDTSRPPPRSCLQQVCVHPYNSLVKFN